LGTEITFKMDNTVIKNMTRYEHRQRVFMLVSIYQQASKAITKGGWVNYPEPKITSHNQKWRLIFDKPFYESWGISSSIKDVLAGRWKS